ncbi:MAG: hypothetical protein KAX49_14255 [Halanaerobiales bacterium]|nr:hypothetical protein [Halanaerobiales bacterium]
MKSNDEDLRKRGFITIEDINKFQQCSNSELILLINSPKSVERSVAINLLSNRFYTEDLEFVKILLERLCVEKCLYTKIEICKALEKGGIETAEQMIQYLGCIGKNQHLCLPKRSSKKSSYPLPRDIIARSLGKMNVEILPVLFNILNGTNQEKISEVIDAIGFMLFYNQDYTNEHFFKSIISILNKYSGNDIIVWKCVVCLSSFRTQGSIEVLNQVLNSNKNDIIKCEAKRSLRIIGDNYEL